MKRLMLLVGILTVLAMLPSISIPAGQDKTVVTKAAAEPADIEEADEEEAVEEEPAEEQANVEEPNKDRRVAVKGTDLRAAVRNLNRRLNSLEKTVQNLTYDNEDNQADIKAIQSKLNIASKNRAKRTSESSSRHRAPRINRIRIPAGSP